VELFRFTNRNISSFVNSANRKSPVKINMEKEMK